MLFPLQNQKEWGLSFKKTGEWYKRKIARPFFPAMTREKAHNFTLTIQHGPQDLQRDSQRPYTSMSFSRASLWLVSAKKMHKSDDD